MQATAARSAFPPVHSLQAKTNPAEIAEILRVEIYAALRELSEYDPDKFEAANEEYLASIGAGKPEAAS